jgi:hypothetical protein
MFYADPDRGAWGGIDLFSFQTGKRPITVQAETLDRLFAGGERVALLKIDTEGHEPAVFRGAQKILALHAPHLCFEISLTFWAHLPASVDTLLDAVRSHGYRLYQLEGTYLVPYTWLRERVCNLFAIHESRLAEVHGLVAPEAGRRG